MLLKGIKKIVKRIIPITILYEINMVFGRILYSGRKFSCPICNGNFRKFLPFGVQQTENRLCPACRSLERHRLLWLYLKEKTNIFTDNLKILYIAPQYYIQKKLKKLANVDYMSADLSSPIAMTKMDITEIDLPDNVFDCIICNHVFEHIPDDEKAMKELLRILKPGGWAYLQVPIDLSRDKTFEDFTITSPEEREKYFWQNDHVRVYGRDYKNRLDKAGFTVHCDNYVNKLSDDLIKRYTLIKSEIIYFCIKYHDM